MNKMEIFLFQIRQQGIDVVYVEDELKIRGPKDSISKACVNELKANKSAILNYLQSDLPQYYPISSLQKRMYRSYFSSQKKFVHHLYSLVSLRDTCQPEIMNACFQQLINEHEILRTGYRSVQGEMSQVIFPVKQIDFKSYQLNSMEDIAKWSIEQAYLPFDLEEGNVIRVCLAQSTTSTDRFLLVVIHHIAADFYTLQIIFELAAKYYEIFDGRSRVQDTQTIFQFKQLVLSEQIENQTDNFHKSMTYWKSLYQRGQDDITFIQLPVTEDGDFVGKSAVYVDELGYELSGKIIELAKQWSASPHNILLGIFELIVSFFSKRSAFNIGIPINKRKISQPNMLGMLVDTYWVRANVLTTQSFKALVNQVKKDTLSILSYLHCGFFDILKELDPPKSMQNFPVFQVMFNYVKSQIGTSNPLVKKYYGSKNTGFTATPYDLMLNISDEDKHLKLAWVYHLDIFTPSAVTDISNAFRLIILEVCEDHSSDIIKLHRLLNQNYCTETFK